MQVITALKIMLVQTKPATPVLEVQKDKDQYVPFYCCEECMIWQKPKAACEI